MIAPPAPPSDAECDAALIDHAANDVLIGALESWEAARFGYRAALAAHAPPREPTPDGARYIEDIVAEDRANPARAQAMQRARERAQEQAEPDKPHSGTVIAAPEWAIKDGELHYDPARAPPAPPDLVRRLRQRFVDAADALASEAADAIESQYQRIAELTGELDEEMAIRERLATLLAEVVVALRGPEPPLRRWSYHDVGNRVRVVVAALEIAEARAEAMRVVLAAADAMREQYQFYIANNENAQPWSIDAYVAARAALKDAKP